MFSHTNFTVYKDVYICVMSYLSPEFSSPAEGGGGSCGILDVVVLKFYAY